MLRYKDEKLKREGLFRYWGGGGEGGLLVWQVEPTSKELESKVFIIILITLVVDGCSLWFVSVHTLHTYSTYKQNNAR